MDLKQYYQRQVSFTEWFDQIRHARTQEMREEDNEKRERLRVLNDVIGLPFDKPVQFTASDIVDANPALRAYVQEHGNELCALRLIPLDPVLPKLRLRGKTVKEAIDWFHDQAIAPASYRADFIPHSARTVWSTIFIVNTQGIFGEFAWGGHNQLTQGYYEAGGEPNTFVYDGKQWKLMRPDPAAQQALMESIALLHVADPRVQARLQNELHATFANNYLRGYFETVKTEEYGLWYIDYNRILDKLYGDTLPAIHSATDGGMKLSGSRASPGIARGHVRIVREEEISNAKFRDGDILVCDMTSPLYIPLMQKAAAIVTDRGGILSHAAIVSRELGKPCITATKNATKVLHDGDIVEVNADEGFVTVLE